VGFEIVKSSTSLPAAATSFCASLNWFGVSFQAVRRENIGDHDTRREKRNRLLVIQN
jgi:hypothetical protein